MAEIIIKAKTTQGRISKKTYEKVLIENRDARTILKYSLGRQNLEQDVNTNDIDIYIEYRYEGIEEAESIFKDIVINDGIVVLAELYPDEFRGSSPALYRFAELKAKQFGQSGETIRNTFLNSLAEKARELDGDNHRPTFHSNPMGVGINGNGLVEFLSVFDIVFDTDYVRLYKLAEEIANNRIASRTNCAMTSKDKPGYKFI